MFKFIGRMTWWSITWHNSATLASNFFIIVYIRLKCEPVVKYWWYDILIYWYITDIFTDLGYIFKLRFIVKLSKFWFLNRGLKWQSRGSKPIILRELWVLVMTVMQFRIGKSLFKVKESTSLFIAFLTELFFFRY